MRDVHIKERWWMALAFALGAYVLFGAYHYAESNLKKSEKTVLENAR